MIQRLHLDCFRSYQKFSLDLEPGITILVGDNGVGKTTILEALYVLSQGRSFRVTRDQEVLQFGAEVARVAAAVGEDTIDVTVTQGVIAGHVAPKKRVRINGVPRRISSLYGMLPVVLFTPEDMELVVGSPGERRRYLDRVLSTVDPGYDRAVIQYEAAIRQRNKLLYAIREGEGSRESLWVWDELVITHGQYITQTRETYISQFIPSILTQYGLVIHYDRSEISVARLERYRQEELASATTLVGPHRDDITIVFDASFGSKSKQSISRYGSRGEQRQAVLALKVAEFQRIAEQFGQKPILLLDDIYSEFDPTHQQALLSALDAPQSLITTADPLIAKRIPGANVVELPLTSILGTI